MLLVEVYIVIFLSGNLKICSIIPLKEMKVIPNVEILSKEIIEICKKYKQKCFLKNLNYLNDHK